MKEKIKEMKERKIMKKKNKEEIVACN